MKPRKQTGSFPARWVNEGKKWGHGERFTQGTTGQRNPPGSPPTPLIWLLAELAGRDAPGRGFERAGAEEIEFGD